MRSLVAVAVLASLGIAACSPIQDSPPAETVPAAKSTCAELVLPAGVNTLALVDRELVPYSRSLLGVEAVYEDDQERTLLLVSGGYLDDITEAYDNLEPAGTTRLVTGAADLLEGSFFGAPIVVAYQLGTDPPCSTLAAVAIGFSTQEFAEIALALELREHGS